MKNVVVEAGVVAGYVIAWALRKARRVGGHLDQEADRVVDAALDRLHEAVATKLDGHPVLAEIVEEADDVDSGGIRDLTLQEVTAAIAKAAAKDDAFGRAVTDLLADVRKAKCTTGVMVTVGTGSVVFTGNPEAKAEGNGIAIAQAGTVNIGRGSEDPRQPGQRGH